MLCDIRKFNSQSVEDHVADKLAGLSLGEYFRLRKFTPRLLNDYLAPTGAAIWSAPADEMLDFPVENLVAFFITCCNMIPGLAHRQRRQPALCGK
jgi:hypothetical protein